MGPEFTMQSDPGPQYNLPTPTVKTVYLLIFDLVDISVCVCVFVHFISIFKV